MTAAAPPPPEPVVEIREQALQRIQEQSKLRRAAMQSHKATVHRIAATTKDIMANTPVNGSPAWKGPDSAEQDADTIRAALDVEDDDDPVDAGFAALRAQSAQRKDRIQRLKDNVASNLEMCRKIGETSKMLRLDPQSLDARRVEPSVDDACALSVPAVHEGLPNPVTRRA